ncbi:MAG TPA: YceI family protein [Anaerolineales bacterium]
MWKLRLIAILTLSLLAGCQSQTPAPAGTPTIEAAVETEAIQVEPTQPPTEPVTETPVQESPATEVEPQNGEEIIYNILPGESQVTYEVGEVFLDQNNRFNTAIGVTNQISGQIRVDQANPQNSILGPIEVDISQFQSDSSRRDNAIRERFLQSALFPLATFEATQIDGLPDSYQRGQEYTLQVHGNLTIREVTKPITVDTTVAINGDTLTASGETSFLMSDFGFGPISIAGILQTEDEVKVRLELIARP